jgi:hypothetical protein
MVALLKNNQSRFNYPREGVMKIVLAMAILVLLLRIVETDDEEVLLPLELTTDSITDEESRVTLKYCGRYFILRLHPDEPQALYYRAQAPAGKTAGSCGLVWLSRVIVEAEKGRIPPTINARRGSESVTIRMSPQDVGNSCLPKPPHPL